MGYAFYCIKLEKNSFWECMAQIKNEMTTLYTKYIQAKSFEYIITNTVKIEQLFEIQIDRIKIDTNYFCLIKGTAYIIDIICNLLSSYKKYEILFFQNKTDPSDADLQYPNIPEILFQKLKNKEYLTHNTFNSIEMMKIISSIK